jgi:putative ATP-binding cassette transporter
MPSKERTLFLPYQPYLPIGTLRSAVSYPDPSGTFSDEAIRDALTLLELGHLKSRLDETEPWDQQLTGEEQQRLTFARAFLQKPDWIFLDDATGALDEPTQQRVYEIFAERLPKSGLLSITNRPSAARHHDRRLQLVPTADGSVTLQPA